MYSLPHAPNLARCTQAARRAPERLRYRTSHATIKDHHHILRWSLDGKERLRREHLQSELRKREAGGDSKQIAESWR